jgi:DNA-binding IclR family transcriptional regulator
MSQLEICNIEKYQHAYRNVEIHGVTSESFKKIIRRLAIEISDANDVPYCIALSYWQRRMSTTLQRMNATTLRSTQVKISRRLGVMHEVDLDPTDYTFNDMHTSLHDMTA